MMPSEFADRMYTCPGATEAHWVPWGRNFAMCGEAGPPLSGAHTAWYGTGDMDEIDTADVLPLCEKCSEMAS